MLPSSRFRKFLLFCGCSLTVALSGSVASAQFPFLKFSPDLNRNAASTSVIIQYASAPTSTELQQLTKLGGSKPVQFKTINALQITLPSSALSTLTSDKNVKYITPDRTLVHHGIGSTSATASIATSAEYTTEPINAPSAWAAGYKGLGVGVAVIDSGIAAAQDLKNVIYNNCFIANCTETTDQYGHGTHVAGLIGGNGSASTNFLLPTYTRTFYGVAPGVNLVNLKVLDANGQGTDAAVIQAIEFAIANQARYNIRIINLSLGRPIFESYTQDPLCQAVEQAWKAGIVVVAAAGNDGRDLALNTEGYGTIEAPGNDPYVLTVGALRTNGTAVNTDDAMASYSSKGPSFIDWVAKPDLVAPGNLVTSVNATVIGNLNASAIGVANANPNAGLSTENTLQQNNPTFFTPTSFYYSVGGSQYVSSSAYMPLSGTSMATGVVSGAAALLLSANSSLTPDQVKALLMADSNKSLLPQTSTVTDQGVTYTAHNDVFTVGAGYLDIGAAVKDARTKVFPAGTAMSPIANYDPNSGYVDLVTDSTALWGRSTVWSASTVYGANAFVAGSTAIFGSSAVDASTALWGRDDPQAYTALFGSTALWGRSTPDAAAALWGSSTVDGSTALWGRSTTSSSGALWGSSTVNGSTALWGRSTTATQ